MNTARRLAAFVLVSSLAISAFGCAAPAAEDDAEAGQDAVSGQAKTAYQGNVAGVDVMMRLERTGSALRGTYFYVKEGKTIDLEGRVDGTRVTLTEKVSGKTTGTFAGTLATGGAITGTWTGANGRAQRFALDVIRPGSAPQGKAILATRKAEIKGAACKATLEYPEVFGLADPAVEQKANEAILAAARPDGYTEAEPCFDRIDVETHASIVVHDKGILSISIAKETSGGAYPAHSLTPANISLTTGKNLGFKDLFTADSYRKVSVVARAMLAARAATTEDAEERGMIEDQLTRTYVEHIENGSIAVQVKPEGLELSVFNELPHAIQALDDGLLLRWQNLTTLLASDAEILPLAGQ